jgi:hypothetical protein
VTQLLILNVGLPACRRSRVRRKLFPWKLAGSNCGGRRRRQQDQAASAHATVAVTSVFPAGQLGRMISPDRRDSRDFIDALLLTWPTFASRAHTPDGHRAASGPQAAD